MSFDLETGVFEATIEADPSLDAPTLVFAPRLHYPGAPKTTVSIGSVRHDAVAQIVHWEHGGARGEISIRLERALAPLPMP